MARFPKWRQGVCKLMCLVSLAAVCVCVLGSLHQQHQFTHSQQQRQSPRTTSNKHAGPRAIALSEMPTKPVLETVHKVMFAPQYKYSPYARPHFPVDTIKAITGKAWWNKTFAAEKKSLEQYKMWLHNQTEAPLPFERGTKGIVMTCRLEELCLANLLYLAHELNSTLPIQLWMLRSEMDYGTRQLLHELLGDRVEVRYFDELEYAYARVTAPADIVSTSHYWKQKFYLKVHAMVMSSFEQVLLVDGDMFLLQQPEQVLDRCAAAGSGAVFWHDLVGLAQNNPIWELMGVEAHSGYSQESGMVFVDKAVAWRALYLAAYMNQKQTVYYSLLYGDKDTFFVAFESLGANFTWVPYTSYMVREKSTGRVAGMLQPDLDGVPLGLHVFCDKESTVKSAIAGSTVLEQVTTYDPNTHRITGSVQVVPHHPLDTTIQTRAAEQFLGTFPRVFTAYVQAAHALLHKIRESLLDAIMNH